MKGYTLEVTQKSFELTCIDKPSRSTFTELFGLVGESYFNNSRNMPWWGLNSDSVGCYQL